MPSAAAPTGIRFEHLDAPVLGIGPRRPRLSWRVPDAGAGHRQRAYEIALGERTFVVESAEQVLVPWPGEPLAARERVEVPVRVRDDEWSPWSEPATVEAGPSPDDWRPGSSARAPISVPPQGNPCPSTCSTWTPAASSHPMATGPGHRRTRGRRGHHVPLRRHDRRLRAEPRRLGPAARARRGRRTNSTVTNVKNNNNQAWRRITVNPEPG